MDDSEIIEVARRVQKHVEDMDGGGLATIAFVREFFRTYVGENSDYYISAFELSEKDDGNCSALSLLESYIIFVENGLRTKTTFKRQAQIDIVSDLLFQAENLLNDKKMHPAAPATLIGAMLEEFLRNWSEECELSLGNRKPGINNYTAILRKADKLTKQDEKDITSWAGIRNSAAHGQFDEIADGQRVRLMLDGVNLFIRQKQAPE